MNKSEIKTLDKIWSFAVKEKYNFQCANCEVQNYLNSHHVISRINYNVRWDLDNGISLCSGDHKFNKDSIHNNPLIWEKKLDELGIKKERLLERSKGIYQNDFYYTIGSLKGQCEGWQLTESLKLIEIELQKHDKSNLRKINKKPIKKIKIRRKNEITK